MRQRTCDESNHKPSERNAQKSIITRDFIQEVRERIGRNRPVREGLPRGGRIRIERQLPFLVLYRRPPEIKDAGTERLATTGASYIVTSGDKDLQRPLSRLVRAIVEEQVAQFGAFLILEIWAGVWKRAEGGDHGVPRPGFRVLPPARDLGESIDFLRESLSRVRLAGQAADVALVWSTRCAPKGARPVMTERTAAQVSCFLVGLDVNPVYRHPKTNGVYPAILREITRGLSQALRKSVHKFICSQTTHCPVHYQVLGPKALVKTVWDVDRRLASVADRFDFLLQVTPVNTQQAWLEFRKSGYSRAPTFHYRPMPVDPVILKRQLFATPVERINDPALSQLFREKLEELDREIGLLQEIGTKRFAPGSVQLYGGVDDDLYALARDLLARLPTRAQDDAKGGTVDAERFAQLARREIRYYRQRYPDMRARVEIRDDVGSGLMVSHGNLLIGRGTQVPAARAEALIQHEIGVHSVTYYNGRAQPFRQLYSGLAGYDALQEGLAVFAEHLSGNLSRPRLRLLALRVVAARHMLQGATFVDTFREVQEAYGLELRAAFTLVMRIYRGGGLTKDAIYLAGLARLLRYLARGGRLAPLFIGKIAAEHIPIIRELKLRSVLREPPLVPRFLDLPEAKERLERARAGIAVHELTRR